MKIGVIGGGNMGLALINAMKDKYKVVVCEKDSKRKSFLKRKYKITVSPLDSLVKESNIIILAVKPQSFEEVLDEISKLIENDKVVISIAAGITTQYIERKLGKRCRVVRTMPNMPALIGEGITAICKGKTAKKKDIDAAVKIMKCVGETVVVKEDMIDAITAVSGSGPAYVFYFAECLIDAAESLGLDSKLSQALVKNTLLGSVHLLNQQKGGAASLRAKVTSKGGTTEAAMKVFISKKMDAVFKRALKSAANRAKELSCK